MTEPRVLLIGMMGVGKSTIGRAVVQRTGWPYLDNDELLHADTGVYGAELLARDGVEALRDAEARALSEILRRDPPLVASAAAAVILRPRDRQAMKDSAYVVWLRARIETLVARVGDDHDRAWLQPDPESALRKLGIGRDPLYAEVADLTIDVDDLSPDVAADQIVSALTGR